MGKTEIQAFTCDRCGHVWSPRGKGKEPRVCPKCKSPYWNTPRKRITYPTADGTATPLALREMGVLETGSKKRERSTKAKTGQGQRLRITQADRKAAELEYDDSFWHPKTFEELAKEQGIHRPQKWEELTGDWPEDADFEEFLEAVRSARSGD